MSDTRKPIDDDETPVPQDTQAQETSADDYKVGYGKPPLASRFRKGQSGNRRGRPKKKRRHFTDRQVRADLLRAMEREVTVTIDGKQRKVPIIIAIYNRVLIEAAKGNFRFARLVVELRRQIINEREDINARLAELVVDYDRHEKKTGEKPAAEIAEILEDARKQAFDVFDLD